MDLAVSLSILLKSSAESFDHLIIEQLPNSKFTVSMRITMMMIIMWMIKAAKKTLKPLKCSVVSLNKLTKLRVKKVWSQLSKNMLRTSWMDTFWSVYRRRIPTSYLSEEDKCICCIFQKIWLPPHDLTPCPIHHLASCTFFAENMITLKILDSCQIPPKWLLPMLLQPSIWEIPPLIFYNSPSPMGKSKKQIFNLYLAQVQKSFWKIHTTLKFDLRTFKCVTLFFIESASQVFWRV